MRDTIEVYTGTEVEVEHVKSLASGGARFDVTAEDGRKWRIDVTREGEVELVTSWEDGTLADLPLPEWIDDVAARLTQA